MAEQSSGEITERVLERAMGIESTALAWEARVLPLYDAREDRHSKRGWEILAICAFYPWARFWGDVAISRDCRCRASVTEATWPREPPSCNKRPGVRFNSRSRTKPVSALKHGSRREGFPRWASPPPIWGGNLANRVYCLKMTYAAIDIARRLGTPRGTSSTV